MATSNEYLPVISKLLARTKERKIDWKGTFESTTFICALEGQYSFEIEKGKTARTSTPYRSLTMKDSGQAEVFVANAFVPSNESAIENDNLFALLDELYEQARRIALDIDKKVNEVTNILDKI